MLALTSIYLFYSGSLRNKRGLLRGSHGSSDADADARCMRAVRYRVLHSTGTGAEGRRPASAGR